ncbi:MAG: hypothetical protein H6Q74_2249 [Firmicutes bacterium]|nr:hypothetical protein [Bacillota bacterium]
MENLEFYWRSLIVPIVVFAPNLLWFLFPPINILAEDEIKEPIALTILENIGRIGVIIIPLFYPLVVDNATSQYCLIAMIVLLLVYYAGWFRFVLKGRIYANCFLPLRWIPIPIPMAVCPVMYFILSAVLLKSNPMLIAALVLAIGHILISYRECQRIRKKLKGR